MIIMSDLKYVDVSKQEDIHLCFQWQHEEAWILR